MVGVSKSPEVEEARRKAEVARAQADEARARARAAQYSEPRRGGDGAWTAVKVGGGLGAVGLGLYGLYLLIKGTFGGLSEYENSLKEALQFWLEEYEKELKDFMADGELSPSEAQILDMKRQMIEDILDRMKDIEWSKFTWLIILPVVVATALIGLRAMQKWSWTSGIRKTPKEYADRLIRRIKGKNPPPPENVPPEVDPDEVPEPPVDRWQMPYCYLTYFEVEALVAQGAAFYSPSLETFYLYPYYRPIIVTRDTQTQEGESEPEVSLYQAEFDYFYQAGLIIMIGVLLFLAPELAPIVLLA